MQQTPPFALAVTLEKLVLLADFLCVAPLAVSSKLAGGELFIPDNASARERSQRGVVLVVGPGDWREDGVARVPVDVAVGDLVFFGKFSGTEEEFGGRAVLVMRETECRMRVRAGDFTVVEHDDPKFNHLGEDFCDLCAKPAEEGARARLAAARAELVSSGTTAPLKDRDRTLGEPMLVEECERPGVAIHLVDRPRRPCAGGSPGNACDMMQTLYPNGWGARHSVAEGSEAAIHGDAAEEPGWVGEICGHRHPAEPVNL